MKQYCSSYRINKYCLTRTACILLNYYKIKLCDMYMIIYRKKLKAHLFFVIRMTNDDDIFTV